MKNNLNFDMILVHDPMDENFKNALAVCNFNLNTRVKESIKANLFSDVEVLVPNLNAFSMAKLGENCVLTDNRELKITNTRNIVKKLGNFINNVIMLIKEKYGII